MSEKLRLKCGVCGKLQPLYDDGIIEVLSIVEAKTGIEYHRCRVHVNVGRLQTETAPYQLKLYPEVTT